MWVPLHKKFSAVKKRKRVIDEEGEPEFNDGTFRSDLGLEKLHVSHLYI